MSVSTKNALAKCLVAISENTRTPFWYRILDTLEDNPDTISEKTKKKFNTNADFLEYQKGISDLFKMSLQHRSGLNGNGYMAMLEACGLVGVKKSRWGTAISFKKLEWDLFFKDFEIDAELEQSQLLSG